MRVLLVAPPWLDIYGNYKEAAKLGCVSPPLGLMYLAGAVLQSGHECRILDMESQSLSLEDLLHEAAALQPDLIGITTTTPVYSNARQLAQALRKHVPSAALAMGGVHPTITRSAVMTECPELDFIVCGEGEFAIQEVLAALEAKQPLADIPGVIYRDAERIIENPSRELLKDLDRIPVPARDLLPSQLYQHSLPGRERVQYASLFTSRGCPFECAFCSQHTMYGRRVRWHSIDRVMTELDYIVNTQGIRHIIIMDETLTLNKKRLLTICREIQSRGLRFTWEGWTHVSTIDRELLEAMKTAGLIRLSFGIESGNQPILDFIKKGITLDQVRTAYRLAHEVGIETRGSAILGHPHETRQTAWETIRFVRSIKECQQVFLNVACPYPGTDLFRYAQEGTGGLRLLTTDYSQYKRYGDPVIAVNDLSSRDLKRLQTIGLLYFYCTPRRIWYNVVKRAGIRAGLRNGFAFLRGIFASLCRRNG